MKPIGYWLNRTDQALTRSMDSMLAEFGLTRLAWQVLNVIKDHPPGTGTDMPTVQTALAYNADPATLNATVEAVVAGGWAARPAPARLVLTDDGRARLAEVAARVHAFRDLSAAGISDEEYRIAVSVLERMTGNVESIRPESMQNA
ncbi:MarR family winged helix-turn-helix transcriptional regulator [Streptomyces klenkii]|uniref:MarR family winged helix-turn-helix transcriptional regulator n=1 Tax=Streptomyces klenkii TaxID=1420899 RepID=UPI0033F3285B